MCKLSVDEVIMDIKRGNERMENGIARYDGVCELCGHAGEVMPVNAVFTDINKTAKTDMCIECLFKIHGEIEDADGIIKRKYIRITKEKILGSL